ncbi:CapA family protein [Bacillus cereus]|uniref:CapA family protein n=1 Tax=Bacillus cereus TaxID=1396 RepID=A0A9X9EVN7_BACCE|nr:CapA family protein [Bacillus cereus]TKH22259.1 CapA family protein [Bacillus cereus]TKJ01297.1 CapA family protein [Bacillus cereus]
MKKKLTFKEMLLIFSKRTKKKNTFYIIILLPIITVLLIGIPLLERKQVIEKTQSDKGKTLTMTLVGDVMMGRNIKKVTDNYGLDYVFRYVSPYFKNSDYVSGNFENPVLLEEKENYEKADKHIYLDAQKETVNAVKEAGFTILNLANNHMTDYGPKGLTDTLKVFQEQKLDHVGAGKNLTDAKNIAYQNLKGVRVATLGFTDAYVENSIATKEQPGVLSMNPDVLFEQIGKAKDPKMGNADLVVVNAHWGEEYDTQSNPRQKALAKAMVDAGADIIVGHHPHVLQSFEVYKNSIIFYSLGNFVFDQGWTRTKDSALVQYQLQSNGTATLGVIPLKIKEGTPRPVTEGLDSERIYRQLTKEVSNDSLWKKHDNKLEISLDHTHIINRMKNREMQGTK